MSAKPPPVFRFAPSPNGHLHLGHALSALANAEAAARMGGRLLLRIEDIDLGRTREAYVDAIIEDLAWLGVRHETEVRRQSRHFDDHAVALERLKAIGAVYPCACTRAEVTAAVEALTARTGAPPRIDPDGRPLYPGTCRPPNRPNLSDGAIAWRLDVEKALAAAGPVPLTFCETNDAGDLVLRTADPARWGDVVLARRDTPTSYHLAVVLDDALQGVTHVIRGRDLEAATDIHVLLQRLLGLPTPIYRFHRLILDDSQRKLAKSRGSTSLRELRASGVTADQVRRMLGFDPAS
jgi:glutamyl-Q tRNA(Asp) synthetase